LLMLFNSMEEWFCRSKLPAGLSAGHSNVWGASGSLAMGTILIFKLHVVGVKATCDGIVR
jgi:hypothetical protein